MSKPLDKVKRSLADFKRRIYTKSVPKIYGHKYVYVFGFTKEGKRVFWGPFMT